MRGGEWCCATALVRDGVPCGLSPMALFMCRQPHWRRRNEGVQRGFEKQQLVDVCGSRRYACAAPHERAVHVPAFVLRVSGYGPSLLSRGVGAKPSVLIRSRALHVTGLGVFVEYLLPTRPLPLPRLCDRGGGGLWIRGCAAALLVSKGPSMCRSSEDHVPSLGETQGHTRTSRGRVCVYSSCPPPPLRCGHGGGGFRTEGMRPAKHPDAYPPPFRRPRRVCVNHSSHAPCACPPGTLALLSCCGGPRYTPPLAPPPPKRCRVHRSVLWHHKTLTDLRVRFSPNPDPPHWPDRTNLKAQVSGSAESPCPARLYRRISPTASMSVRLLSLDWAARVCG